MAAWDSIFFFSPQLQSESAAFCEQKKSPATGAVSLCSLADRKQLFSPVQLRVWLLMEMKVGGEEKSVCLRVGVVLNLCALSLFLEEMLLSSGAV